MDASARLEKTPRQAVRHIQYGLLGISLYDAALSVVDPTILSPVAAVVMARGASAPDLKAFDAEAEELGRKLDCSSFMVRLTCIFS